MPRIRNSPRSMTGNIVLTRTSDTRTRFTGPTQLPALVERLTSTRHPFMTVSSVLEVLERKTLLFI